MADAVAAELERLVRETDHHADVARRSTAYMVQFMVALTVFGLAPLIPGGRRLFGEITAPVGLAILAPGVFAAWVSVWIFRRRGSESRVYRTSEAVESTCLYGATLAMLFASRTTWSVLWILPPFTAAFWANTKPFASRLYVTIIAVTHAALALAFLGRGDATSAAGLACAVGATCIVVNEVLARRGRQNTRFEAQRNVLRAALASAQLDAERERVATMLRERVGDALAALTTELASPELADQARAVLLELHGAVADPEMAPMTLAEVGHLVDARCRPLCLDAAFERSLEGEASALVPGQVAHALVRVAQELVRNSVTHGRAQRVRVDVVHGPLTTSLVVRDDGIGLSADALVYASGGLDNARRRLAEQGGDLVRVAGSAGTELHAVIPRAAAESPARAR